MRKILLAAMMMLMMHVCYGSAAVGAAAVPQPVTSRDIYSRGQKIATLQKDNTFSFTIPGITRFTFTGTEVNKILALEKNTAKAFQFKGNDNKFYNIKFGVSIEGTAVKIISIAETEAQKIGVDPNLRALTALANAGIYYKNGTKVLKANLVTGEEGARINIRLGEGQYIKREGGEYSPHYIIKNREADFFLKGQTHRIIMSVSQGKNVKMVGPWEEIECNAKIIQEGGQYILVPATHFRAEANNPNPNVPVQA